MEDCGDNMMDGNMKPKLMEISISKQSIDSDDPKMKVKKELLGQIRGMAMKAMKDSISKGDAEIEDAIDMAPGKGDKPSKMVSVDKGFEKPMDDEDEVEMLPENPGDAKKDQLKQLMSEMEELKSKIQSILEE